MDKKQIVRQMERELIEAHVAAEFWRKQLPHHLDKPVKSAVERSLENALGNIAHLEAAKKVVGSA